MTATKTATRTILITGVSSGLGHGMARAALERGDAVFGLSRRTPEDLTAASRFGFAAVDLAQLESIASGLEALLQEGCQVDLAVLNAGILGGMSDLGSAELANLKATMQVNLWANKVLIDSLLQRCRVKQVVAISSGASVSGARGWSGYGLSKAALNMMIKLYAAEQPSVHFASLAPGLIDTAMQDTILGLDEQTRKRFPTVERLSAARGTEAMPDAATAGARILAACDPLLQLESGSYADIRNL